MAKIELSEIMKEKGKMIDWSTKVKYNVELSEEEKEISSVIDEWASEIGYGTKPAYMLSQYLIKTLQPELIEAPDALLDMLFDRGTLGEFDTYDVLENPKNNLLAVEAGKFGNVDKSYIDYNQVGVTWVNLQIETEVKMSDLRKNGAKTIANLTLYAEEAFKNKMFRNVFNKIDTMITTPSNQGWVSTGGLVMSAMDQISGYLLDNGENPLVVGLSTDMRAIAKMTGYTDYLSEAMKDAHNKYGIIDFYGGVKLSPVNASRKMADGSQLLPKNKIFGVADKIGELNTRGDLRVLQTPDNNREVIGLKFTGFEFGYAISKPEKVCKILIN